MFHRTLVFLFCFGGWGGRGDALWSAWGLTIEIIFALNCFSVDIMSFVFLLSVYLEREICAIIFLCSNHFICSWRMLENRSLSYRDGPIPVPSDDPFLLENIKRIQICDSGDWQSVNFENYFVCNCHSLNVYDIFLLFCRWTGAEP